MPIFLYGQSNVNPKLMLLSYGKTSQSLILLPQSHKELEFNKQILYFTQNIRENRINLLCCTYQQQEREISNELQHSNYGYAGIL
jgi:hypothetical protein